VLPYIHFGPLALGTQGFLIAAAFVAAFLILRADVRRRSLPVDPRVLFGLAVLAGIVGAKLWWAFERSAELLEHRFATLVSAQGFAWYGGLAGGVLAVLLLARRSTAPALTLLDAASPAAALGYGIGRLGGIMPTAERVHPTPIYEFLTALLIFYYLWRLGARSLEVPKATGEIFAGFLILSGVARFAVEFVGISPPVLLGMTNAQAASLVCVTVGAVLLRVVKRRFRAHPPTHRVIQHKAERGDVLQREYHRPTPECPHPERWRMYDAQSAEVEVLEFLKAVVTTLKPELVVETGTFLAMSTIAIAEGLRQNGFGRVITCEADSVVFAKAKERIEASGLSPWIEARNESSLEMRVEGRIDLLYCDSEDNLREPEVRRFLPQVNPHGLVLIHDASSHRKTVREAALRMEKEGLLSVVLLPTPRGLVVAQKREGRQ